MASSILSETASKSWKWLLPLMLLVVAASLFFWREVRRDSKDLSASALDAHFESSVRAAAYLENVQYDQAEALYGELLKQFPNEPAYLRNSAIAALANIKYHMDLMQDANNDVEQIRGKLPDMFDRAAAAIEAFRKSKPDDPIAYQLDVLRDLRWISVLSAANPIIADEEQAKLLDKLKSYVGRFPTNAFLVTQFNNSAETMSAVDPKILEQTVLPLRRVHDAYPRNIYLLSLLIQRLVQLKDPSALELVEPLAKLLEPFEWKWKMERRPKDLSDLRRAVELGKSDPEGALGLLIGWVGEAKSTEGSLVDAKGIDISELAFLDLSDVQRMVNQQEVNVPEIEIPKFRTQWIPCENVHGVKFFDWNVDTHPELLVWTDSKLTLGEFDADKNLKEISSLPIPFPIEGVLPVDLFAVAAHRGTVARAEGVSDNRASLLATAMRHETIRDLVLYGTEGVKVVSFQPPFELTPHWSILEEDIGLGDLKGVTAVTALDWESDGDLDLALICEGRLVLRENIGNRQFRDVNTVSTMPPQDLRILAMGVVDWDRDVDLDILISHADGFAVMENIQHGQFRFRDLGSAWKLLGGSGSLAIGDFNNNYSWDVLGGKQILENADAANQTGSGIQLVSTSTEFGKNVVATLSLSVNERSAYVMAGDWNNDTKLDFFSASELGLTAWINRTGFLFAPVQIVTPESIPGGKDPQQPIDSPNRLWQTLSVADVGNDGWLDCAYIIQGKLLFVETQPNPNDHYLAYRVKGISDANGGGRNNQYCVGSTVEVFGPFGYQARVIEDDSVHFGLGPNKAYSLRTIFVNGLTQGIIDPKSDSILEEEQVLIGSCPFAYGWDGQAWQLMTDLLWNAPLGLQVAKGKVLPDRRWEYLLLPRTKMQPFEDAYEIRITEELWESAYFDHLALLAIDHPATLEVLSNEKVGPPSLAQPSVWTYRQTQAPRSAVDSKGRDWTEALSKEDGQYAFPFDTFYKQGLVEECWLELDFGPIDPSQSAQLILTGWIHPTDTSLNIGIDQNPNLSPPSPPRLLTVGTSGQFETRVPFMGFPGGKPKTIVVPLDGIFSTDDHRIRIAHSSCIYWDRIRLGVGESNPIPDSKATIGLAIERENVRARWLPLQSSQLQYRGFSRAMPRARHEPHWYDYQTVSTAPAWPPLAGRYTRYGDVFDVVQSDDDWLVVMGAGDEMRVRFAMPEEPPPEGWVRDFVLHSVGWDKDAAMNTLEGQSSLPLPFSRMQQYPPGMDDREEERRIDRLHRSTLTREQSRERFWKPNLPDVSSRR
jgi:tetratricopeptide (TPR) repeat protein